MTFDLMPTDHMQPAPPTSKEARIVLGLLARHDDRDMLIAMLGLDGKPITLKKSKYNRG